MRTPVRNPPVPVYAEFETHRTLLRDRVRTEAFQRALEEAVRPGDVVLDVGAGTGVLGMFAARVGAGRVYAVEQTSIARLAEELVAANGLADVVNVILGDIVDVDLPERVDVLVSEWLGGFGIDEGMLVPVLSARDRWLRPGGTMIPASVVAWTALVDDPYVAETLEFLRRQPYGLDLTALAERTRDEIFYSGPTRHLSPDALRSEPAELWTIDALRTNLQEAKEAQEAEVLLPVRRAGMANALGLWFSATLHGQTTLANGPGDPPTHWGMTTAPLGAPVALEPGRRFAHGFGPNRLGGSGPGRVGRSSFPAGAGSNTTSSRFGRRSTTELHDRSARGGPTCHELHRPNGGWRSPGAAVS